ncbi:hypothetical protein LCGC14_0697860 [marine sediment metagenome]|uniref:EamA domain-containing protein n=1 Tax=marine sediment metagenome TaxID=412755 RepID=A0A0F9R411_9ZZZZ|nr:MAG: EamA-like transporter family protein [Candidatus Lokiarchaeum sp. GC14_75]
MPGELLAILAVFTFVGSNVIFRKIEQQTSPTYINFFRTAMGTITFILLILFLNKLNLMFMISWGLWLLLIVSFIFGQVIGDTAYFIAQKELGTTIALAISMTFPLFTFVLSLLFLDRPFTPILIISLLFIGSGITIIGKSKISVDVIKNERNFDLQRSFRMKIQDSFKKSSIKAIGYCIVASLGWAIGAVLIDFCTVQIDLATETKDLSSIIGNTIRFPFALLILSTMVWREKSREKKNQNSLFRNKTKYTWVLLLGGSILGTSLGAYLYTESVHLAGASFVSLIATTSPLFALPLTYVVNKEKISKFGFIGVFLTIIGVVVILL